MGRTHAHSPREGKVVVAATDNGCWATDNGSARPFACLSAQEWEKYKVVLGRTRWIGTVEGVESLYYQTCL